MVVTVQSRRYTLVTGGGVAGGDIEAGLDGFIYHGFRGHPPGYKEQRGFQFARYNYNGVRDWEILCTISNPSIVTPKFALGPQGKLWLTGDNEIPGEINYTKYIFVWSFQPTDGSLRFARQWECDRFNIDSSTITDVTGIEVNSYGVAVLSGIASSGTGDWVDHTLTIQDTNWEITHDSSFTFVADDPIANKRDLPITQTTDVGMVDPPVDYHRKTFIMLYRP